MRAINITAILAACLLMLVSCSPPEENTETEAKLRAVQVEIITTRDLPIVVHSVGRLAPNREVVLSAEVSGILTHYDADVGDRVNAGAVLAAIDDTDYALALDEAEANLTAARVNLTAVQSAFERAERLLPEKAITVELYDKAEAEFKSSRALVAQLKTRVALARRRLEKTRITAPFAGYITQRHVEKGQNVSVDMPMMEVAEMKVMRVKINISEMDYAHLDVNDPVTVNVEAFDGMQMTGTVDEIGIQADARTNTFAVEILVDNSDIRLKAGLTARVAIQTEVISNAIMIPQNSVIFRENWKEVFIIDQEGRAAARKLKLGRTDGSQVRVLEGLAPGESLVVAGGQYLKPGEKVMVTP